MVGWVCIFIMWLIDPRIHWDKIASSLFFLSSAQFFCLASSVKKLLEHVFQFFLSSCTGLKLSQLLIWNFHQVSQKFAVFCGQMHWLSHITILFPKYFFGVFTWALPCLWGMQRRRFLRIFDYFNTLDWWPWLNVGDSLRDQSKLMGVHASD